MSRARSARWLVRRSELIDQLPEAFVGGGEPKVRGSVRQNPVEPVEIPEFGITKRSKLVPLRRHLRDLPLATLRGKKGDAGVRARREAQRIGDLQGVTKSGTPTSQMPTDQLLAIREALTRVPRAALSVMRRRREWPAARRAGGG